MGTPMTALTPELQAFIEHQHVFFVASAPSGPGGHVNLSPKGLDTFRVLSPAQVAYLDITGSGNETAAHVAQNGRLTFMFCAFDGKPRILRLFGTGRVVLPTDPQFNQLAPRFPALPGIRQIILMDISRVKSSCGFGLPLMTFTGDRTEMPTWALDKGEPGLAEYRMKNNRTSLDGLPAPGMGEP